MKQVRQIEVIEGCTRIKHLLQTIEEKRLKPPQLALSIHKGR